MDITLEENWKIESDRYSIVLKNRVEGKKTWSCAYYPTLEMALKKYLNEKTKDSSSVEDILKRIREVEAKIKNFSDRITLLETTGLIIL